MIWRLDDTIRVRDENSLKQWGTSFGPDQAKGAAMWDFIINLVYDRSCEKYLAEASRQADLWI
jgi:hypothetical protein